MPLHPISPARTRLAAFLLATLTGCRTATAWADDHAVDRFDSAVAQGLPASIELPATTPNPGADARRPVLRIDRQLNLRLRLPGRLQGRMFGGTIDDRHVVMTRWGNRLDVTHRDATGIRVERYRRTAGEDDVSSAGDDSATPPIAGTRTPGVPRHRRASPEADGDVMDIHLFVHDDVASAMNREDVHAGYVAWWLDDVNTFLPRTEITVTYHPVIHGVTDMPYRHMRALATWNLVATQWAYAEGYDDSPRRKYVLVTLQGPEAHVSGLAMQGGPVAIAAVTGRYRVIAHELGHLFGADHALAETRYLRGWWCESNMYGTATALRSNCYRYSKANQDRIRHYLTNGPDGDTAQRQGPEIID